jgi:hypothetical protein
MTRNIFACEKRESMNRYSLLLLVGVLSGTALHGQSAGITATTEYPSAPVNNVANYPGADLCAKVNAAIATLGTGAVIDARGFNGTQTCSANVVFGASNITLLLSGNLNWKLGSHMLFASGNVGGIRILGGGRPIGSTGQQPGCVKSPELGRGTCIFSANATAAIQLGDGANTWTKTKGMNPATDDVVADLTVIQNSATGDGYLLEGTFDAELVNVGAWDLYPGNTAAAFHEFGVITPTGSSSTTCAWEWGTQVYHPNFGAFHRGWYEESPTGTGSCLPYIGTVTGGNNQFYGGFIGGVQADGIGIDWAGPISEQNWVFGTDVETSNICLHIASSENRFYGRLEGSNCTVSVELDGSLKGGQGNEIAGVYNSTAISVINGANADNNLFWAPYNVKMGPTGDFSIFSLTDAPQTIRFGSGKTKNQATALQFGTNASGSFVPWAQLVMSMTNPNSGLAIRDRSGANRFVWWGSNTNLAGTNGGGILINADKDSGTAGLSVFSGGSEPVRWSQLTNGLMLSGDPPKVSNGQIGFGAKTAPATSCGSLPGASGCIAVNINGSLHYVPYW